MANQPQADLLQRHIKIQELNTGNGRLKVLGDDNEHGIHEVVETLIGAMKADGTAGFAHTLQE